MKIDDILSRFPTREEVSKLVGLRQPQSGLQDEVLTMFGAFGAGLLLGAGLALLLAPKPGQDLRRELAEKLNHASETIRNSRHEESAETAATA